MGASMEIVNGFQCRNCTDVDYAKRHIDPAHPKDGPYGINAADPPKGGAWGKAVELGGSLAGRDTGSDTGSDPGRERPAQANGPRVDLKV